MAKIVIQIEGMPDGTPTPFDGEYVAAVDFEAGDGRGAVVTTKHPELALHFDTLGEALTFYQTQPKCKPFRPDGEPNRPLTATNMSFMDVKE